MIGTIADTPARSVFLDAPQWNHAEVPEWFADFQQRAWREFASLPMPNRRNEAWRFADLAKLNFDGFAPAEEAANAASLVARCQGLSRTSGRVVFVNDRLVHAETDHGVRVLTLSQALASSDSRVQELLTGARSDLGSAKFLALHNAHLQNVAVILIPKGMELEGPIEMFHWLAGESATVFPRTIVIAGENAKVTVLEHHDSANQAAGFSCGVTQLAASEGAVIDYVFCQSLNGASKAIHLASTHCAKSSKVKHAIVNLGAAWARTECVSHLDGAESRSDMLSISLTDSAQEIDQRTLQLHHAPHSGSDLLYKNVLFGESRAIFAGLIRVDEGAHYTDAYQTCRNLLMTDSCEANAMPGLEINADQVKCSHGSTTGAIDPEQIFYFKSRGVPEMPAKGLLAQGFLAQVMERLGHEDIENYVLTQLAKRFQTAMA